MVEINDLYKVESIEQIRGNDAAIRAIREYAADISKARKRKPLLLYGPSGTGKTAAAHAIADQYNWHILESGANDYRDAESLAPAITAASSKNVFGQTNAIIFDEIDELAARFDTGAATAINTLIENSRSAVIFIANNMWDRSISFLRAKTEAVRFHRPRSSDIADALNSLAHRHNIKISSNAINFIAAKSNGDVRSAINDMYTMEGAADDDEAFEMIGARNRKSDIFEFLDKVFLSNTLTAPLIALANVDQDDVTRDMIINWLDENIPRKYLGKDLSNAFDSLADATLFNARASRNQYYGYWRYMNVMMSSGITLAKTKYPLNIPYMFPRIIKALSTTKTDRAAYAVIAKLLQRKVHANLASIKAVEMKLLSRMCVEALKHSDLGAIEAFFATTYGLEDEHVGTLIKLSAPLQAR